MAEKKKSFSLQRMISNDKSLIVVALLLAVLVWIVVSLNIGTDETKTITINAPITLSDELSQQMGMQYYTLQDNVELSVTLSGPKYVIGQVTEDDLSVKFDTTNVNRAGAQTIPILVTNKSKTLDFEVTSTYPSAIDAYFDVAATKTYDLYLNYDADAVADGYMFGTPVMSEDRVVVNGPNTYIEKLEQLSVNVDLSDREPLTEAYNTDCEIEFVGLGAEARYLTVTSRNDTATPISTVNVTLPVLKVTDLPVAVNFEDMPADLPEDALDIKYSVRQLHVGVLNNANISSAIVGTIPFSSLYTGTNTFYFKASDVQGVTLLDEDVKDISVEVTVASDYQVVKVPLAAADVEVDNVPEGYTATVKSVDFTNVWIIAPNGTAVTAADLSAECDLSAAAEDGTYPVELTVNNNSCWIYGAYNATVALSAND
ncbi:MAG: hypothetical protein IJ168_11375 [Eubacterium sp.]|nr:hypothetical protein [Eubacterium sp.]